MSFSSNKEKLRGLIEKKCLIYNTDIKLNTGAQSSYYFDCKSATLDGECLSLIVNEILQEINYFSPPPTAIGGLTTGADFIVSSVVARAYETGQPAIHGSIVRKYPKKHGTENKIENQLNEGTKIVVVDDVITTGSSIEEACKEFKNSGYVVVGIIAIIDRLAGGKEKLAEKYAPVRTLFDKNDFSVLQEN